MICADFSQKVDNAAIITNSNWEVRPALFRTGLLLGTVLIPTPFLHPLSFRQF
jgi:hypothetical protein